MGHEWWYIRPTLRRGSCGWEKDLQFFAACPTNLSQLPKLVGLIYILGKPACPKVVNRRPILSHIGHSPYAYCALTGLRKLWPVIQMHAARLSSTIFVVAMVVLVAKYHEGQIIVLPALHIWLSSDCGVANPSRAALPLQRVHCRLRAQQVTRLATPMA